MNARNLIVRTLLTLFAIAFGLSYGCGLFSMYADFFGSPYPNPDEQNTLAGYLLAINAVTITLSVLVTHILYNKCRRKRLP